MPKPKNVRKAELPRPELWIIRACLTVALGISVFLAWSSGNGGGIPGCGPESACDKVLSSRWAYVGGWPVSVFALPIYAGLLALLRGNAIRWKAALPLALIILAAAIWFTGIQIFALRAFCKFCMTAHTAGVIAALMLLRRSPLDLKATGISIGWGLAASAAVLVAQVLTPAPSPKQIHSLATAPYPTPIAVATATTNVPPSPVAASQTQSPPPLAAQPASSAAPTFTIVDGQFTLALDKVPVAGPLNAPKKVAKLFDYTCHHCRDLHHLLHAYRLNHSNELAVISLPMPLDSACNPLIKRTPEAHANACDYAILGLAVFEANPAKFEEFSNWIYAPPRPPPISAAREYAAQLVAPGDLESILKNPAVAAQLKRDIDIYQASYKATRSGQMPQMFFERGASIGAVKDAAQLEKIMADNLGLQTVQR